MILWTYTVQFSNSVRRRPDSDAAMVTRQGLLWALIRECRREDGTTYSESLAVSLGVFNKVEDTKLNTLESLSMLACRIEKPIEHALRWKHEAPLT